MHCNECCFGHLSVTSSIATGPLGIRESHWLLAFLTTCTQLKINTFSGTLAGETGAHNDNEKEKGKGRSVNHPCERLKFQNFLTVVALLSLEHWRNVQYGVNQPQAVYVGQTSQQILRRAIEGELVAAGNAGFISVK